MFQFAGKFYSLHLHLHTFYSLLCGYSGTAKLIEALTFTCAKLLTRFLQVANDFDWMHVIYLIYCDLIHSRTTHIFIDTILCALPFICQIHAIPIHAAIRCNHFMLHVVFVSIQQKSSVNATSSTIPLYHFFGNMSNLCLACTWEMRRIYANEWIRS